MTHSTDPPPVVRTIEVAAPPARAFEIFTAHMGDWWPLRTHSVHGADAVTVRVDGRVGGDVVERSRTGETCTWGTVLTWEPGVEVAFRWHPGGTPQRATRVRIRFEPSAVGTRVVLVHDGWQARPDADAARDRYESGWEPVLAALADRVGDRAADRART